MKKETKSSPKDSEKTTKVTSKRAKDPEHREKQLISLAINCAEEQMRNGTASSAVITHFLKLATGENEKKLAKLDEEVKMLRAKTEALESSKRQEELYAEVIEAFKSYI